MKFECGDLDRALQVSDLMPEAREHLKTCAACRREYRLWTDISATAKELHETWDSPELWPEIRKRLEAEPKPKRERSSWRSSWEKSSRSWQMWGAAAAVLALALGITFMRWRPVAPTPANQETASTSQVSEAQVSGDRDFLTDQALKEVERTEAAYRESIAKLSRLAEPQLQKPDSALTVSYREKLVMLDSAIAEMRANLSQNRFNVRLQTELADLYREKQQTLKELVSRDQKN